MPPIAKILCPLAAGLQGHDEYPDRIGARCGESRELVALRYRTRVAVNALWEAII